jgi:hypothetical protein
MSDIDRREKQGKKVLKGRRPPLPSGATDDEIVCYLQDLAVRLGKETVTTRDVQRDARISPATIHRRFGGFSEVLVKAGLRPMRIYKRNRTAMLQELASLMAGLGRIPSKTEVRKNLSHTFRSFEIEFGSLSKACELAKSVQSEGKEGDGSPTPVAVVSLTRTKGRRRYGAAIDFRGLRHAPINELGVVLLFGMLAEELGFVVESVQDGFPDCDAKLRRADGTFEGVRIEFEFRSSEFNRHGHDLNACDLIVCWLHDWADCPLDVITLSDKIEELRHRKVHA